jgi:protein-S-isoprenylcysteine O-methyltransferase Ste14
MPRFIIACWIIFIAVWFVAAWRTKRNLERQSAASRARYALPLFAGVVLLIARPLGARIVPATFATAIAADVLCAFGLLIAVWARLALGGNWSSFVAVKENHELVRRGPYRFVRHPIYSGLLLMLLATALAVGRAGALVGFALCFLSCWIKLRQEEELMLRYFPTEYPAYKAEVNALVPYVL